MAVTSFMPAAARLWMRASPDAASASHGLAISLIERTLGARSGSRTATPCLSLDV